MEDVEYLKKGECAAFACFFKGKASDKSTWA